MQIFFFLLLEKKKKRNENKQDNDSLNNLIKFHAQFIWFRFIYN